MERETIIRSVRPAALSRRGFLKASGAVAAGAALGIGHVRVAVAQEATIGLGHFGSANPQHLGKATKSWEKTFGSKVGVKYVQVNSGGQVVQYMSGGSLDVCNAGSSPIVVGMVNGAPISMIYVAKYITDSEALVVRTDRGIESLKDLKGKTIGTPFNSSAHFALLVAMRRAGLGPSDARILNTPPDQLAAAWKQGAVDAAYIWQPIQAQMVGDKGRVLLKSSDLIDDGVIVFDGIVVRDDFKKRHPDLVLAYLKENDRLSRMYVEQPAEVAKTMSEYLQLPLEQARAYVDSFHPLTPKEMAQPKWFGVSNPAETGVHKALMLQAQFLKDQGAIPQVPDSFVKFIDQSFLAKMV